VLGSDAISEALDRAAKGRLLAGHRINVTKTAINGALRSCHLLYISDVGAAQGARLAGALRDLPVLTIVDAETAASVDGVVRVSLENGRMRFDLDHGLAKRERLQLSSKLLSLASHIKDAPAGGPR
ncbi:MAG: YfiR family protein, partial [Acidobacteriota bacterium]